MRKFYSHQYVLYYPFSVYAERVIMLYSSLSKEFKCTGQHGKAKSLILRAWLSIYCVINSEQSHCKNRELDEKF